MTDTLTSELRAKMTTKFAEIYQLREEADMLSTSLSREKERNEMLAAEKNNLETDIQNLKEFNDHLKKKLEQYEELLMQKGHRIQELQKENNELHQKLKQLSPEI